MHRICNLKFEVLNEISAVFHEGSNYHHHFVIKELANEFEWQFECIGKSKEKYKNFSVPIKRAIINIYKDGNKTDETMS